MALSSEQRAWLAMAGLLLFLAISLVGASVALGEELDAERLFGEDKPLSSKAAEALAHAEEYREADQYPHQDGHRTVYLFGAGEATVVCAPLVVCLVELEPGERIAVGGVLLGDPVRWHAAPAIGAAETTHVAIKPVDVGLATTLALVTDRRTYHMRLQSREEDYMPSVGWDYPADAEVAWAIYQAAVEEDEVREATPSGLRLSDLDFDYEISGCRRGCPWRPVRVFNDGRRTIIELPPDVEQGEAPVLLVMEGDREAVANYRVDGTRYLVDGVPGAAILVVGVGRDQQKVTIRRRQ